MAGGTKAADDDGVHARAHHEGVVQPERPEAECLRTADKVLISGWQIDSGELLARIELQNGERIYGFGDKRAAMNQRGRSLDILNRDAFASETNESYKSVPFYVSSNGYGLFLYNFYPSVFDVAAGSRNRLQVTPSAASTLVYKRDLSPVGTFSGWIKALLPNQLMVYQQSQVHFAPTHYVDVSVYDPAAPPRRRIQI